MGIFATNCIKIPGKWKYWYRLTSATMFKNELHQNFWHQAEIPLIAQTQISADINLFIVKLKHVLTVGI